MRGKSGWDASYGNFLMKTSGISKIAGAALVLIMVLPVFLVKSFTFAFKVRGLYDSFSSTIISCKLYKFIDIC